MGQAHRALPDRRLRTLLLAGGRRRRAQRGLPRANPLPAADGRGLSRRYYVVGGLAPSASVLFSFLGSRFGAPGRDEDEAFRMSGDKTICFRCD